MRTKKAVEEEGDESGSLDGRGQVQVRMGLNLSPVEIAHLETAARVNSLPPEEIVSRILRDCLVDLANQKYRL
jgi:hypothetical protein